MVHLDEMARQLVATRDTNSPLPATVDHVVVDVDRSDDAGYGDYTRARPVAIGDLSDGALRVVVMDVDVRTFADVKIVGVPAVNLGGEVRNLQSLASSHIDGKT